MSKTAKNAVIYLLGTGCSAAVSLLNTMVVTRILAPELYARYGILVAFFGV